MLLRAEGLTRRVRDRVILHDVSFHLAAGTTTTVLGPSGSGKTTLLRLLMGLERPHAGTLHLGADCLSRPGLHVPPEERSMSLVFQEYTLFPNLDVAANLAFGLRDPRAERGRVDELLQLLEIAHLRDRHIHGLSGGEQQRVALGRALAVRPRVLLMDEPFSNVDRMLREGLFERLRDLLRDEGITTLIATHDHGEAFYFSDSILVLKDGELMDHNPPRLIYERPANAWVAAFFGGTNLLRGSELGPLATHRHLEPAAHYLVRPEAIRVGASHACPATGTIREITYYGAYSDVHLALDGGPTLRARCTGLQTPRRGERVGVALHDGVEPHALP